MKSILEIKSIAKKFKIRHETQSYLSLRDSLMGLLKFKRSHSTHEHFWALEDVTFDVMPGECVGIIGKNGAGKSTLLKILSKITPPTKGTIISRGRIASLLEVGTGFHPELTGRENVYLNGSILGMRKKEIDLRFDEIIDFSGTEKFLDTPLKHYSSGMQLRLAFSVAAFLEPEILVIDEVLAVGDAEFQKKCMGKMQDVSKNGRTILFVSHSMEAIRSLCSKVVVLEKGKSTSAINTHDAIQLYLSNLHIKAGQDVFSSPVKADQGAVILEAKILNSKSQISNQLLTCEEFNISIKWENIEGIKVTPSIELVNFNGVKIFWSGDTLDDWDGSKKTAKGQYESQVTIPANFLKAGEYSLTLGLYTQRTEQAHHIIINTLHFSLNDPMDERCLARGEIKSQFEKFIILPSLKWMSTKLN